MMTRGLGELLDPVGFLRKSSSANRPPTLTDVLFSVSEE